VIPALTGGPPLSAQAVERTDVPERGVLRVTFDPRIMTWNDEFTDAGRTRLGFGLSGDLIGSRYIPALARLEQNVNLVLTRRDTLGVMPTARARADTRGFFGFVASLGAGLLSVRQERRTYPVTAELGVTRNLSLSVMVPIVRVATRSALRLQHVGNLGLNPRMQQAGAEAAYQTFFTEFDSTLKRFDQNITAGMYGCAGNTACPARDSLAQWRAIYDALHGTAYGLAPFMPLDSSAAGRGIDTTVARIERDMVSAFGVAGFSSSFLLPTDTLTSDLIAAAIVDSATGFGYNFIPFRTSHHYGLGDVEVCAKYRFLNGSHYAAAVKAIVRLPTAQRDSADDLFGVPVGDHLTDIEGQLTQELTAGPLWLNVAVRAGTQRPGTQVRRVAPPDAFLVPAAATANLAWDPGDYAGIDVAPLVRFAPEFAAGFTVGYWTKARDRYAFMSSQDSVALATRLGAPTSASVLEDGTAERRLRLGFTATYHAPAIEGGFSIEQTVSGVGRVPAVTVYRLVMRVRRKLF